LRNSLVPSRRHNLQTGPVYLANLLPPDFIAEFFLS
jgi:hypothetical protein